MAWVAGFCLGPFGSNERTWKPFNPILGETFELDFDVPASSSSSSDSDPTADASGEGEEASGKKKSKGRFLAEQVSHHPPIGAAHADAPRWSYDIVSAPTTKFLGNSIDIYPVGRSRIHLKEKEETYSLVPPNSKAHNLIVGRTWVDCYGDFSLLNTKTGTRCLLRFTPCGWFGAGRYEVKGHVVDAGGGKKLLLEGAWNSHLDFFPCDAEGNKVEGNNIEVVRVWQCSPKPEPLCKYGFTKFAKHLCGGAGKAAPLASDSRRRPDRAALERGDHAAAGAAKHALEEVQRAEKKERARRGEEWEPRWFVRVGGEGGDAAAAAKAAPLYPGEVSRAACPMWSFRGRFPEDEAEGSNKEDVDGCVGKGFSPWQYPELHGGGGSAPN